ncbi:MAG: phosphonate C-P lyase system protein PhnL [Pseudomonadota bacterium]
MAALARLTVQGLMKSFCLHLQGDVRLKVLDDISFGLADGECLVIRGPSGLGKSTLLRLVYGNYQAEAGEIFIRHQDKTVDLAQAASREVLAVRKHTMSYVSQFLRCLPRISALDVVAEPLQTVGVELEAARHRAAQLLSRLAIPERLFEVPPATFSGGEQQRVNIARSLVCEPSLLLIDEPTASLDVANRDRVLTLFNEHRDRGAAILAVIHDSGSAAQLQTRTLDIRELRASNP